MKSILYLAAAMVLAACAAEITTIPIGVSLDQSSATLSPGETLTLTPEVIPDEAANKTVSWSSSNPDVAMVTDGVVTAITEGTAVITVTTHSGQRTAYFLLTVAYPVSHVVLNETAVILAVGESQRLTATVFPNHAPNKNVNWISSNPDVVEVVDGVITAKARGTATVSVVTEVGGRIATCAVRIVSENHIVMTTSSSGNMHIRMSGSGTVTINWGDGSAAQTHTLLPSPLFTNIQHFHSGTPPFVITIEGDDITRLDCSNSQLTNLDVSRITGLIYLNCANNQLTSLDVSSNPALITLNCQHNQLTSLDVSSNPALTTLNCQNNQLTSLDVSSNPALTTLNCSNNQLTSLDVSNNPALTTLNCQNNQLTSLDASNNPALTTLNCQNNQLTSLDVSNNPALITLNFANNQLTSLDVSNSPALTTLNCDNNLLTSLDVSSNPALTTLNCSNNQLTSLDVSSNPALITLNCFNNQLTSLDVSNNPALITLNCFNNQLTSLDVSNNPALTTLNCSRNQLTSLDVSNNPMLTTLDCSWNQLTSLDVTNLNRLTQINLFSNQLSVDALNALFKTLPIRQAGSGWGWISIGNNPGTAGSDRSIATSRGWIVH